MKKVNLFLCAFLIAAVLIASSHSTYALSLTPPTPCGSYGDVDNDGYITATDADFVLKYAVGSLTPADEQKKMADVTADGNITASDALMILRYSNGTATTFPVCPSIVCTDSDGGQNYYVKGYVNLAGYGWDSCKSSTTLMEQDCGNVIYKTDSTNTAVKAVNYGRTTAYNCPNGCNNGACTPPEQSTLNLELDTNSEIYSVGDKVIISAKTSVDGNPVDSLVTGQITGPDGKTENLVFDSDSTKCVQSSSTNVVGCTQQLLLLGIYFAQYTITQEGSHHFSVLATHNKTYAKAARVIKATSPNTACTDSDSGQNYYVKGYVNLAGYGWDYCKDSITLMEQDCGRDSTGAALNYGRTTAYACPNGCFDGACTQDKNNLNLEIDTNRDVYSIGDRAVITAKTSSNGNPVDSLVSGQIIGPDGKTETLTFNSDSTKCAQTSGTEPVMCTQQLLLGVYSAQYTITQEGSYYFTVFATYNKTSAKTAGIIKAEGKNNLTLEINTDSKIYSVGDKTIITAKTSANGNPVDSIVTGQITGPDGLRDTLVFDADNGCVPIPCKTGEPCPMMCAPSQIKELGAHYSYYVLQKEGQYSFDVSATYNNNIAKASGIIKAEGKNTLDLEINTDSEVYSLGDEVTITAKTSEDGNPVDSLVTGQITGPDGKTENLVFDSDSTRCVQSSSTDTVACTEQLQLGLYSAQYTIKQEGYYYFSVSAKHDKLIAIRMGNLKTEGKRTSINTEIKKGWNLVSFLNFGSYYTNTTCKASDIKSIYSYFPIEKKYAKLQLSNDNFGSELKGVSNADEALLEKYWNPTTTGYLISTPINSVWLYSGSNCKIYADYPAYTQIDSILKVIVSENLKFAKGWTFFTVLPEMKYKTIKELRGECKINDNGVYLYNTENKKWINAYAKKFSESDIGKGILIRVQNNCVFGGSVSNMPPKLPENTVEVTTTSDGSLAN